MIFVAAFVVTVLCRSLAGQVASIFLGLGVLVAFVSWFQMRLEENERLEKLELDELAEAGRLDLFDAKDPEVFPRATRARTVREIFRARFCACCCCCSKPAARGCSGAGFQRQPTA